MTAIIQPSLSKSSDNGPLEATTLQTCAVTDYEKFFRISNSVHLAIRRKAVAEESKDSNVWSWEDGFHNAMEATLMDTIRKPTAACIDNAARRFSVICPNGDPRHDHFYRGYITALSVALAWLKGKTTEVEHMDPARSK